jgi:hypothetical protein
MRVFIFSAFTEYGKLDYIKRATMDKTCDRQGGRDAKGFQDTIVNRDGRVGRRLEILHIVSEKLIKKCSQASDSVKVLIIVSPFFMNRSRKIMHCRVCFASKFLF